MFAALQFPNIENYLFKIPSFELFGAHLGPFPLRWYALAYIAGLVVGWRYMVSLVTNADLWAPSARRPTSGECDDFLFWATLGVIGGGRIGFILFYMLPSATERALIAENPFTLVETWNGGMSFHGGLIGVTLATFLFAKRHSIPVLTFGDIIAACAPIGLFFGRLANFVNGELWGRKTDAPWGMVFCNRIIMRDNGGACPAGLEPRHPSQLYEASLEGLALFTLLWFAVRQFQSLKRPGLTIGLFLACYGLFRLALENVRQPDATMPEFPLGLTMGMLLSAPMVMFGAGFIIAAFLGRTAPTKA